MGSNWQKRTRLVFGSLGINFGSSSDTWVPKHPTPSSLLSLSCARWSSLLCSAHCRSKYVCEKWKLTEKCFERKSATTTTWQMRFNFSHGLNFTSKRAFSIFARRLESGKLLFWGRTGTYCQIVNQRWDWTWNSHVHCVNMTRINNLTCSELATVICCERDSTC